MLVEGIMFVGVLAGYFFQPKKWAKALSVLQMACTAVLIFCMGVSLENREGFFQELSQLGLKSLVYAVIPVAFSVISVYLLTKRFMETKKEE
ncbi:MAG TPA: LysO family transporter [Candidatus Scybalocola faecigallinarum]|uniref:LysO family transporter n=1 Tax=Candidatus Scybalocola faecigallinarum TaxID=2840941 RepID=A0A9D1F2U6_9FIRM|nr:LysO family transporter [Candidatus Scybalocola faecigallinarum]